MYRKFLLAALCYCPLIFAMGQRATHKRKGISIASSSKPKKQRLHGIAAYNRLISILQLTDQQELPQQIPQIALLLASVSDNLLNRQDSNGLTLLMKAVITRNLAIVQLIGRRYHDFALVDRNGHTALHHAASQRDGPDIPDIISFLVSQNADVNALDHDQWTPLAHAALVGNAQAVSRLLARQARYDVVTDNDETAPEIAVRQGNVNVVEAFIEHSLDVNALNRAHGEGNPLLLIAVGRGDIPMVGLLLRSHADVNAQYEGYGALHLAVQAGSVPVAQLLIDSNALVDILDESHRTPLISAAAIKQKALLKMLIRAGACVTHRDNLGRTALHHSAWSSDCIDLLLDAKATIDVEDTFGCTPLRFAAGAINYHARGIRRLIQQGANATIAGNNDMTAQQMARQLDSEFSRTPLAPRIDQWIQERQHDVMTAQALPWMTHSINRGLIPSTLIILIGSYLRTR